MWYEFKKEWCKKFILKCIQLVSYINFAGIKRKLVSRNFLGLRCLISLHIRSMWETICDAQAHSCTHSSNNKFLSKFSSLPLSGISDRFTPPPLQIAKLQIWGDDQSLLRFTSPQLKNFSFEITKVYSSLPTPPKLKKLQFWNDQSLLWFTPPLPNLKNYRFEMTKVYSSLPPPPLQIEKLQIWDDQSLLQFTPPPQIVLQSGRSYVDTNL